MLPSFIGIGAPKAGTTWLSKCLEEHPQIFIPKAKELMFFDYLYDKDKISEYENVFPDNSQFTAMGEISPNYLSSQYAPERIKEYNPNVKLFVSLRSPVDQIYSYYWHTYRQNVWLKDLEKLSFEEAIEQYQDFFLKHSFYMKHLKRWLEYFDSDQIHIIIYDDIINQPQVVIKNLYSFLEVDNTFIPSSCQKRDLSVRQGTSPKNHLAGKLHAFVYQKLVIHVYNPLCKRFGYQAIANLKEYLKFRQLMHSIFYQKGYPEMSLKVRNNLKSKFVDEVQQLSNLINRDLRYWIQ